LFYVTDPLATDKTLSPKIVFYDFWVPNLRVKSVIITIIEDNIFEGMTYRFYNLFHFDFVFDFQNKQKYFVHLNDVWNVWRQSLDNLICHSLNNII